jgi:hypothetical protein
VSENEEYGFYFFEEREPDDPEEDYPTRSYFVPMKGDHPTELTKEAYQLLELDSFLAYALLCKDPNKYRYDSSGEGAEFKYLVCCTSSKPGEDLWSFTSQDSDGFWFSPDKLRTEVLNPRSFIREWSV